MNVFLSCTKAKKSTKCKAKEMYSESALFQKSYEYAQSLNPDRIYILSAKHHLLPLDQVIMPYNETLNDATVDERKEWTEEVLKQMKSSHIDFDAKTYFFCGENYIEFLKEHFSNYESVYDGKGGIGDIMHWLDNKLCNVKESLRDYLIYQNKNNVKKYIEYRMKNLKHFLNESLLLEAAPKFNNSVEGIEAFCDYVYDKNFVKWVVNPDLTITITPVNPAPNGVNNLYMHTKDLKEIPDFIVYSGIEGITLGLASDSKLKTWEPNVNGVCAGVIINSDKLVELNLTNCDCVGGKLYIEQCKSIKKIVGGNGDGVQVYIKKNNQLEYLDLKKFKNCLDPGSYVSKNRKLSDTSMIPSEIAID